MLKLLRRGFTPIQNKEEFGFIIVAMIVTFFLCNILLKIFKSEMSDFKQGTISGLIMLAVGLLLTLVFPPVT